MTWMNAYAKAVVIFLYIVVFTVVLPDLVIGLNAIATASNFVRDSVVLVIWGAGFVAGLAILRRLQARDII